MDDDPADGDVPYRIGYRKPPEHTRFKAGQSGNPKGKRKVPKDFKSIAKAVLNEKVTVRTAKGSRRMSKLEALFHASLSDALKGDRKASEQVFKIAREVGLADEVAGAFDAAKMSNLSEEDRAILDRHVGRGGQVRDSGFDE
jgi:hypothetical protein